MFDSDAGKGGENMYFTIKQNDNRDWMCFTDIGFHQESYFNMFESDNKMKIYLSCLLLENTWSYLSTKLFQPQCL